MEPILSNVAGGLLIASLLVRFLRLGTGRMTSLLGSAGMVMLVFVELRFGWTVAWIPPLAAGLAALLAREVVVGKGPFLIRKKASAGEG